VPQDYGEALKWYRGIYFGRILKGEKAGDLPVACSDRRPSSLRNSLTDGGRGAASGARGDRAELARVIKRLQPGDVLVVTRLDRMARFTRNLLNDLEAVKQAGAGFRSLKDAWCDTTTPHGVLMLTILGGLRIRADPHQGPDRRRPGASQGAWCAVREASEAFPHQRREAIERLDAGDAVVDVARTFGVDRATLYRLRAEASE
jgi:DNA invertase Pin-like site-specific DNA recombinase